MSTRTRNSNRTSSSSKYRSTASSRQGSRHSMSSRGSRAHGVLDDGSLILESGAVPSGVSSRASGKSRQSEGSTSTTQLLEASNRAMRALRTGGASTTSSSSNTLFTTRERPENFLDDLVDATPSYERKAGVQHVLEQIRRDYGPVARRLWKECQHFLSRGSAAPSSSQRQSYIALVTVLFVWTSAVSIHKINDMSDPQIDLSRTQMNQPYNLRHHKALYQEMLQQPAMEARAKALDTASQNGIPLQAEMTIARVMPTEKKGGSPVNFDASVEKPGSENERWAEAVALAKEDNAKKGIKNQKLANAGVLPLPQKDGSSKIGDAKIMLEDRVLKNDQKQRPSANEGTEDSNIPSSNVKNDKTRPVEISGVKKGREEEPVAAWRPRARNESKRPPTGAKWVHPRHNPLTKAQYAEHFNAVKDEKGNEEEPDLDLGVAPWRPRGRNESKRPPTDAKWVHPRHNPLTKAQYAEHFNAAAVLPDRNATKEEGT